MTWQDEAGQGVARHSVGMRTTSLVLPLAQNELFKVDSNYSTNKELVQDFERSVEKRFMFQG